MQPAKPNSPAQNLAIWEASGEPQRWIESHGGAWCDSDIQSMVARLGRQGRPIEADAAKNLISQLAQKWRSKEPVNESIYWIRENHFAKVDAAKFDAAIDDIRTKYPDAGVGMLVRLFKETPLYDANRIGLALIRLGRQDVLLEYLRESDRKNGLGSRHNYATDLERIAGMLDEAADPAAVSVLLPYVNSRDFSGHREMVDILERGVKGHIQELDNADLAALTSLQDVRCRWSDPNDDETITGNVKVASIRGAAQEEQQRRRPAAPVVQRQREFREADPLVPKFTTTDIGQPRLRSFRRFLGLFKRT